MSNSPVETLKFPNQKPKQTFKPAEGHEIPLASAKKHRKLMTFKMMNGSRLDAYIFGFDRFTITVEDDDGRPVTIFKHAITSFCENK